MSSEILFKEGKQIDRIGDKNKFKKEISPVKIMLYKIIIKVMEYSRK